MDRPASNLRDVQWIAHCAERLRVQWPRADRTSLEEAAGELWEDETLRALGPVAGAEKWLSLAVLCPRDEG